jgi:hypothetical protein
VSETVYPVPGLFLQTVPAAEHECSGRGEHAICIESGAFTTKRPRKADTDTPADTGPSEPEA